MAHPWAFAFAIGAVFAATAARSAVNDGDLFWHLATARWVVEHGEIARADTFSSTALGAPVPQHEWLSQLLLYAAYVAGSWWGIVVLRAVAVLALATTVLATALRAAPRPSIAVLAAAPGLALSRVDWNDRVELYALACFAAFLLVVLIAREGRTRALVALPPLFLLWANLHGSFALGIGLLALLAAEVALFAPRLRGAFLVATLASAAAAMVHPDGPLVYLNPVWHLVGPPRFIEEWRPIEALSWNVAIFAAVLLAVAVTAVRARGGTRWLALLAPLAVLGFVAVRYAPFFTLAAAPYLAAYGPRALGGARIRPWSGSGPPVIASMALGVALVALSLATAPREPDLSEFPVRAAAVLPADGVMFNEYVWGGYLMWVTERPVFVDGRLRPYAGRVIEDYLRVVTLADGWEATLDRHGVTLVLVKSEQPLVTALRRAGWRTVAEDPVAAVLRRP